MGRARIKTMIASCSAHVFNSRGPTVFIFLQGLIHKVQYLGKF
jgi:hypothetical protein